MLDLRSEKQVQLGYMPVTDLLLLNCYNDIRAGQQKADNCQTHLFLRFCGAINHYKDFLNLNVQYCYLLMLRNCILRKVADSHYREIN